MEITQEDLYWILSCSQNSHSHLRIGLDSQLEIEKKFREEIPVIIQNRLVRQRAEEELKKVDDYLKDRRGSYNQGRANAELVKEILNKILDRK